ncbi:RNA 2'-phosphotransferase [Brevifollis gellanilyticus]|uniref:Probable RNA 2'-phosphotransferase n=1 Tax=Brevifollis gellanilyticus TaxID=748831 RepID=A0A512MAT2_9BACT|nr:RNA 2'-phosphotransferase [Brevifollis gellanilyticus]GEP43842.1 putative RNA 2'-phosphotransferase [Brevifollis gellanilyticus]
MTPSQTTATSKFLSLVLRHQPHSAYVTLDPAGWVDVSALLAGCARAGKRLSREDLDHIVTTNAKKRFEFSEDGARIRACQGHSVEVDLDYTPQAPPAILYHGTATRFLDSIRAQGLLKMQRHHVHLAEDTKMTMDVGARHGKPVLLTILAAEMQAAGHIFFRSTNGVWLVEHVPVTFLRFS